MSDCVVDSSAVLALLWGEPGGQDNWQLIVGSHIGTVNFQEVLVKLIDRGRTLAEALHDAAAANLTVHPHAAGHAEASAGLRSATRALGLSLGDRSCLALGAALGLPVVTADRTWTKLDVGVQVLTIR